MPEKKTSHAVSDVPSSMTIKDRVWQLLDKNPLLTAKAICKLLDFDFNYYESYVGNCRHEWKTSLKSRRGEKGSFPDEVHHWHGHFILPPSVDPKLAVAAGWIQTKARNHYLLWKSKLGRMEWHPWTRKVKTFVRKPVSEGKKLQLMADGFFNSGLIFDMKIFEAMVEGFTFKKAQFIWDMKQKLPKATIKFFAGSNGFIFRSATTSHPTCYEFEVWYPDWAEKNEELQRRTNQVLESFTNAMEQIFTPKPKPKKDERMVV